jgi:hypothetical protein
MKTKLLGTLLVVGLIAASALFFQPQDASGVFQQDPGGGGGSGGCEGYLCTYCCETSCGCTKPSGNFVFTGSCACSSIGCYRSCEWAPVGG